MVFKDFTLQASPTSLGFIVSREGEGKKFLPELESSIYIRIYEAEVQERLQTHQFSSLFLKTLGCETPEVTREDVKKELIYEKLLKWWKLD